MNYPVILGSVFGVLAFFFLRQVFELNVGGLFREIHSSRIEKIRALTHAEIAIEKFRTQKEKDRPAAFNIKLFIIDKMQFLNLQYSYNDFVYVSVFTGCVIFATSFFLFPYFIFSLFFGIWGLFTPFFYLAYLEKKTKKITGSQVLDLVKLLRDSSTGYDDVSEALGDILQEIPEPMGRYMRNIYRNNINISIDNGIENLGRKIGNENLMLLSMKLHHQRKNGDDLFNAIDNVHRLISYEHNYKTKNSRAGLYGNIVFNMLLALYFGFLFIYRFFAPAFYETLFLTPGGRVVIITSMILFCVNFVLNLIISIKG